MILGHWKYYNVARNHVVCSYLEIGSEKKIAQILPNFSHNLIFGVVPEVLELRNLTDFLILCTSLDSCNFLKTFSVFTSRYALESYVSETLENEVAHRITRRIDRDRWC